MRNNLFWYIFILFIIIIMVFAIYKVKFQDADTSNSSSSTSSSSGEVVKGTEMTLAISNLDTINPIITTNKKVQDIDKLIYEPLIEVTEDYNLEYTLALECAKSSETTYIVKLRQNVKWSDGNKFTSEDVKYTIDKLKESTGSVYSSNVDHIEEVDIIDDYTLKIILSQAVNNFEYYLSFPILSSSYYGTDDFWNTEKNEAPVTTGQYMISEVTNNTIVLEKNENWWNKSEDAVIEKITINLYSSVAEMYNAFKMGNIDLITTENASYQDYVGTIGYNVTEIEGREYIFLALNTNGGYLSDSNVRKAIRAMINKDDVISNSYGSTLYKSTSFLLNSQNYLIESQDENFYNTEEASNLLVSSGWELVNGIWQKKIDSETLLLEINLVVRSSDSTRCQAAENIKSQLLTQGIIVDIIYADDTSYNEYLNNVNYDMMLCDINQSIAPDLTTYLGDNNLANFNNSEITEILNNIKNITDESELKSNYQRIYEIFNDQVPYIGIARNKILAVQNTNLVGEIKATWYSMFYNIKEWYTTD